ncbi:hypothetical protein COEREDRAFT_85045 [Coemansia reversa NRRL 1564]|uniref:SGNH hydrolase n=1 Tax=Coemansia reversa (strain ATCC 12441 / NRRL 1564) TaxID=763665 RepID=A0A2G5BHR6_COERN|nr:hypothetical protein COEREDRAFT_85045 [Coemansia reversa NRRL 1564]|eukprot:PIA18566.1 hypothetical protein COEREDRAFT_85045 [Coemansia reversa NRRL 1564]
MNKILHCIILGVSMFHLLARGLLIAKPTLHVFGDSLSDIGKLKNLTHEFIPPKPYWNGRFSSGPVWNEYLSFLLDYKLDNHAIGTAKSITTHHKLLGIFTLEPPSTYSQISDFAIRYPHFYKTNESKSDLAILEVGSNDAASAMMDIDSGRQTIYEFALQLSNNVIEQLQLLELIGFKRIIVLNLPPLQETPIVIRKKRTFIAAVLVATYNNMLNQKAYGWAKSVKLDLFDVVDLNLFVKVAIRPNVLGILGITDTKSFCVGGSWLGVFENQTYLMTLLKFVIFADSIVACNDPSTLFFFDPIHPSERVHRLFGYYIFKHIQGLEANQEPPNITENMLVTLIKKHSLEQPVEHMAKF